MEDDLIRKSEGFPDEDEWDARDDYDRNNRFDVEFDDDDDDEDLVLEQDMDWRDKFNQVCLRIANNDETLVHLKDWSQFGVDRRRKWLDADLILLGRSLVGNTFLRSLCIETRLCTCDDTATLNGINAIRQGIAMSHLQSLKLQLCCGPEEATMDGVAQSMTLKRLSIVNSNAVDVFKRFGAPRDGERSQFLTHLTLEQTHVDSLFDSLAMLLSYNRQLVSLNLQLAGITDTGIAKFCQGWTDDSSLEELNFSRNTIGSIGAQTLMRAVSRHSASMKKLVLNKNGDIGYHGIQAIGEHLPQCCLQHLEIAECVSKLSPYSLSKAARRSACQALAQGLRGNSSLLSLSAGRNRLGASGVQVLMQAVAVHPKLRSLSLVGDLTLGFSGVQLLGLELRGGHLKTIKLSGLYPRRYDKSHPDAQKAGRALLEAVKNNVHLTIFSFDRLDRVWMTPIQCHVSLNKICRPLLRSATVTSALWPHVLAWYDRIKKQCHIFFCLCEQPWLVNVGGAPPTMKS